MMPLVDKVFGSPSTMIIPFEIHILCLATEFGFVSMSIA